MLDAAEEATTFSENQTWGSLDTNRMLTLAIVKSLEVLGEAAFEISRETHDTLAQVPWPNIINMRNRPIHAYFDINLDIVWKTVIRDLPHLISELEQVLQE